jgi:hypothetical protein
MTDDTNMLPRRQSRSDKVMDDLAYKALEAERLGDFEAAERYWAKWREAEARSEER